MNEEKEVLEKIETGIRLERKDVETIKNYVVAGFWLLFIAAGLSITKSFM